MRTLKALLLHAAVMSIVLECEVYAQQISAGQRHSVAIAEGGLTMVGWGRTSYFQGMPQGSGTARLAQISAGRKHTCGVTTNNDLICAGISYQGSTTAIPQGKNWSKVEAGNLFTCGLTTSSELFCWGLLNAGPPSAALFVDISLGTHHNCGILNTGYGFCWGNDHHGQISGMQTNTTWSQLSAGRYSTCGITSTGELQCWGQFEGSHMPEGKKWLQIDAGRHNYCGITVSNEAYCWGGDSYGVLSTMPVNNAWLQISVAEAHACGVTTSVQVICWGNNYFHQNDVPTTLGAVDLSPVGSYRRGNVDIPCPIGMSSRAGAMTVLGCFGCSLGQETSSSGCSPCSRGTYRSDLLQESCVVCPKGNFEDTTGSVSLLRSCEAGRMSGHRLATDFCLRSPCAPPSLSRPLSFANEDKVQWRVSQRHVW